MSHLWVRPHPTFAGRFEVIDGEKSLVVLRDLAACGQFAGRVPVHVTALSDERLTGFFADRSRGAI